MDWPHYPGRFCESRESEEGLWPTQSIPGKSSEMVHGKMAVELDIDVCFCDPLSPEEAPIRGGPGRGHRGDQRQAPQTVWIKESWRDVPGINGRFANNLESLCYRQGALRLPLKSALATIVGNSPYSLSMPGRFLCGPISDIGLACLCSSGCCACLAVEIQGCFIVCFG